MMISHCFACWLPALPDHLLLDHLLHCWCYGVAAGNTCTSQTQLYLIVSRSQCVSLSVCLALSVSRSHCVSLSLCLALTVSRRQELAEQSVPFVGVLLLGILPKWELLPQTVLRAVKRRLSLMVLSVCLPLVVLSVCLPLVVLSVCLSLVVLSVSHSMSHPYNAVTSA